MYQTVYISGAERHRIRNLDVEGGLRVQDCGHQEIPNNERAKVNRSSKQPERDGMQTMDSTVDPNSLIASHRLQLLYGRNMPQWFSA